MGGLTVGVSKRVYCFLCAVVLRLLLEATATFVFFVCFFFAGTWRRF